MEEHFEENLPERDAVKLAIRVLDITAEDNPANSLVKVLYSDLKTRVVTEGKTPTYFFRNHVLLLKCFCFVRRTDGNSRRIKN